MYIPNGFDWYNKFNRAIDLREQKRQERRVKIKALLNDSAASEGEKQAAREALKRMESN